MNVNRLNGLLIFLLLLSLISPVFSQEISSQPQTADTRLQLTLEECIQKALENNHQRKVSQFAVDMAEAQHKQALSAFWPELAAKVSYVELDENPNFIIPSQSFDYQIAGLMPFPIQGSIDVPEMNIQLMDKRTVTSSLVLTYPLFTGGKIRSIVRQAKMGLNAAQEEARRTDLQVVYDVRRMFWGSLLAKNTHELCKETLTRMEVTLDLTEELYKKSSGTVKKTDYLRNKVVVESLRSIVAFLESGEIMSRAALTNTMGLDWEQDIMLVDNTIPYAPFEIDLRSLVTNAYAFNPDWAKIEAGLTAAEARIREKQGDYFPQIGFEGTLNHLENDYEYGLITPENTNSWSVGLGMHLTLFRGFRTRNSVKEARARVEQLKEQKIMLREGIALQIKDIFYRLMMSQQQHQATTAAAQAAEENRELNIKAYQQELVETQDVIEAQLMEFFVKTQHYKALFDHIEAKAHLDYVVGTEVEKLVFGQ